jgi:hypothetical protein
MGSNAWMIFGFISNRFAGVLEYRTCGLFEQKNLNVEFHNFENSVK